MSSQPRPSQPSVLTTSLATALPADKRRRLGSHRLGVPHLVHDLASSLAVLTICLPELKQRVLYQPEQSDQRVQELISLCEAGVAAGCQQLAKLRQRTQSRYLPKTVKSIRVRSSDK